MRIRFEMLELEDFAIYPGLRLDFSLDDEAPLTIIRGENESGKTTLMRAFTWILFGERYVPAMDNKHPIRPPWKNDDEDALTTGTLRFNVSGEGASGKTYKLVRKGR